MRSVLLPILAVLAVFLACAESGSDGSAMEQARRDSVEIAELLTELQEAEASEDPIAVVEAAEAIIARTPGTPEADTAAAFAERHAEAAAEERQLQAEEAERQRLARKWNYSSSEDAMTGEVTRTATIRSENTVSFGFPYEGSQHGTLMIRDHPTYGRDVIVKIERGQILCRSYEDCTIRIRFDEGSPQSWRAVGPADNSTETIFLRNQSRFRQRLASSDMIRIQIPVYQQGEPFFEFKVGGYDHERFTSG